MLAHHHIHVFNKLIVACYVVKYKKSDALPEPNLFLGINLPRVNKSSAINKFKICDLGKDYISEKLSNARKDVSGDRITTLILRNMLEVLLSQAPYIQLLPLIAEQYHQICYRLSLWAGV